MHCVLLTSMDALGRKHITIQTVGGQSRIQMPDQCEQNHSDADQERNIQYPSIVRIDPQTTKPARLPEHGHGNVHVPRPCHR